MKSSSRQELDALRSSESFDEKWYLQEYPDVKMLGMDPIEHYLWIGRALGRKTSQRSKESTCREDSFGLLDPAVMASMVTDRAAGMDVDDARRILDEIFSRKGGPFPKRKFQEFDSLLAGKLLRALFHIPELETRTRTVKISVIMPTYNRGSKIRAAIDSALNQSHRNLELLIVDDGSTDATAAVLDDYRNDPRVKIFVNDHEGVSKARNTGLDHASGEIIFYLDSDNQWTRDFVQIMVMSLLHTGEHCAYAASRLQNNDGDLLGYRGEPFNWASCADGNYVDMNVFCHRRSLVDRYGKFDVELKRMVDWDLIVRYTKEQGAIYSPIIGCLYVEDADDLNRITLSQPNVFGKIVREKNLNGHGSASEALAAIKLKIAIKVPAPFEARAAWGDFHFAESLKDALEQAGHEVRIDFLRNWYDKLATSNDDVAIVLRGLTEYRPIRGQLSLLWNISHPDQVSYDEYERFHGIFVASESYANLLSLVLQRDVQPLMQCTDRVRFSLVNESEGGCDDERPGVFVGNSRKRYRELVRWSVENDVKVDVYGQHWESFIPPEMIKGINVDNKELSKTYGRAKFVLNDHWESMRDFGFVSNRIFDVLGCGGRLVSDHIPSIPGLFGRIVTCVRDEQEFRYQMKTGLQPLSAEDRRAAANFVHDHHSFDARAETILTWIRDYLSSTNRARPKAPVKSFVRRTEPRKTRVGLLLQQGQAWPTSSAYIRLIAPLTTDVAHMDVEVVQLRGVEDPAIDSIDRCIVQRIAVPEMDQAEELLARLGKRNVPLFVDTDDAFFFHESYRVQDTVLRHLMKNAQECWFSTPVLATYYDDIPCTKRIMPNALDPRFWRNYRKPADTAFSNERLQFLYMGTVTHDEDFDLVYPALKELAARHPDRFDLTVVGAVRKLPNEPWIHRLSPPAGQGSYPKFVRWLMANNGFDVGIAPLQDTPFNRAKSDIKFLDYSAMGLLSVVSDSPAYRGCIDRKFAIGCRDREEWLENLGAVLATPSSFEPMRKRALEYVWAERNTLGNVNLLSDILGNGEYHNHELSAH